jgi:hypothetical protein
VAVLAVACRQGVTRPAAWAGFGLSLAGVAVIASGRGGGASLGGDALVLLAQLGSAGFVVSQARLLRGRDPLAVTAVQLLAAAVVTLPLALTTEGLPASHASPAALLATIGLIVAGTVGPTTLFAFGQSHVSADVAGAFLNLEPLVGAVTGIVLFGNQVGLAQLSGGAAILAGIALSSLQAVRAERQLRASAAGRPAMTPALVPVGADGAHIAAHPLAARLLAHRPRTAPLGPRFVRWGARAARHPSRAARPWSRAARAARPRSRAVPRRPAPVPRRPAPVPRRPAPVPRRPAPPCPGPARRLRNASRVTEHSARLKNFRGTGHRLTISCRRGCFRCPHVISVDPGRPRQAE